jgi:hypothetical protein
MIFSILITQGLHDKLDCILVFAHKAVRNPAPSASPSSCMAGVGGTPRPQRCPLQRPLRVGPLLSPPRFIVSLFITINTVLWVYE